MMIPRGTYYQPDNEYRCSSCETPYETEHDALECCQCENCAELQRKYEALVAKMKNFADKLAVPITPDNTYEAVMETAIQKVATELRALLEDSV